MNKLAKQIWGWICRGHFEWRMFRSEKTDDVKPLPVLYGRKIRFFSYTPDQGVQPLKIEEEDNVPCSESSTLDDLTPFTTWENESADADEISSRVKQAEDDFFRYYPQFYMNPIKLVKKPAKKFPAKSKKKPVGKKKPARKKHAS